MKTIAQELGITKFPFEIKDKRGNVIYRESLSGYWGKWIYNLQDMEVYYENSEGTIIEDRHYPEPVTDPELKLEPMKKTIAQQLGVTQFPFDIKDERGNLIYLEFENQYWSKYKFDKEGKQIYYENSKGEIKGDYPKTVQQANSGSMCQHKGRRKATELVEYCEDCKKILFHP
jgi:hypothetical protein